MNQNLIGTVIMKTFEVDEISQNLEIGKFYNVLGLVNAKPVFSNVADGLTVQRLSIINIDRVQMIIEIWNTNQNQELTFAPDWRGLQLLFLRDAKYQGVMNMREEPCGLVYIFKIAAKSPDNRFIWISSPSALFWTEPLLPRKSLMRTIPIEEIELIEQEVL